jgi:hypothetical protein
MKNNEKVGRYSLILETENGNKYYFDTNVGNFIKLVPGGKISKSSLPALDFLTSSFSNRESLRQSYGIEENITKVYITYQFKGEKKLAPIFNNEVWQHIAMTYKGKEIDFRDQVNSDAFNEVYNELSDLNSSFATELINNKTRLINLSPRITDTIVGLRAHENAIKMKQTYGFPVNDYNTYNQVSRVYSEDRYGFYQDLRRNLSNYRDFRTVYMNYCKFKRKEQMVKEKETEMPKKKAIIPPHQISMFDNE